MLVYIMMGCLKEILRSRKYSYQENEAGWAAKKTSEPMPQFLPWNDSMVKNVLLILWLGWIISSPVRSSSVPEDGTGSGLPSSPGLTFFGGSMP